MDQEGGVITFLFPWSLILLPLPILLRWALPRADGKPRLALRVPFFNEVAALSEAERPRRKRSVLMAAGLIWALMVCAAAQPAWLEEPSQMAVTGRDMMLVIDISGSMRRMDFAVEETLIDRLGVVKQVAGKFIERRKGDRLGLILFGARPHLASPVSFDRKAVGRLMADAEIALAGEYTAVGDAIGLAIKRLRGVESQSKVIVLLTDGANNAGRLGPKQAALLAKAENIRIYTIGVGRDDTVAPNLYGKWSSEGPANFEREILQSVAERTGGVYFHALDTQALEAAYRRLDELEPALGDAAAKYFAKPLYPWLLGLALLGSVLLAVRWLRRGG